MAHVFHDVMNAQVHPGSGGQAIRVVFEMADPELVPRQPSAWLCTLTMLRQDAEHLLEALQTALNPPAPPKSAN